MKRAIKNHLGDFAAIIALLIGAIAVSGYILGHERLRFPLIESSPVTMNAEFQTAQAITPGQGQTVRVSGVQDRGDRQRFDQERRRGRADGDRPEVQERDPPGRDCPGPAADRPSGHVHRGRPGSKSSPIAKSGFTIPVLEHAAGGQRRRGPQLAWTLTPAPTWTCSSTAPGTGFRTRAATSRPGARALRADAP